MKIFLAFLAFLAMELVLSKFYLQSDPATIMSNVLSVLELTSATQCLLRCKRKQGCKDIAMKEKDKCYLLAEKGPDENESDPKLTTLQEVKRIVAPTLGEFLSIGPFSLELENKTQTSAQMTTSKMLDMIKKCPKTVQIRSDFSFKAKRDNSHSSSTVTYYRLDTEKEATFRFDIGTTDLTTLSYKDSFLLCSGNQCNFLPKNRKVPAVIISFDFNPRDGQVHKVDEWDRNEYSLSGTYMLIACP